MAIRIPTLYFSHRLIRAILSITVLMVLAACSQPTDVTSTWHEHRASGRPFAKILVVGVTENAGQRRRFENAMAAAVQGRGATAWASHAEMAADQPLNRETVGIAVDSTGADAVLVTRLVSHEVSGQDVDARTTIRANPETESINNIGRYDYNQYKVQNLFGNESTEYEEAGYTVIKSTVTLSTDFYETEKGKLIYSLETTTYEKESAFELIDESTRAIAERLGKDRLIR